MWKQITIAEKPYFISCHFGEDKRVVFILYDFQQSWCETLNLDEVKRKVKALNRRFDFNEDNIRTTLAAGEAVAASLETEGESHKLKLEYRVMKCAFKYEWAVRKQTVQEFHSSFVQPLFKSLVGCREQIEILTSALIKKDAEILQYRTEGAILGRKTLATKFFDFAEFNKRFESSNKHLGDLSDLGKFMINTESEPKTTEASAATSPVKAEKQETEVKPKEDLISKSPGKKKRKLDAKRQQLERSLHARRQCFEYESSQSQQLSSSQSTEDNVDAAKNDAPINKANTALATSPKKTARCTPTKLKNVQKSSDDKTDSESEDIILTPRKRLSLSRQSKTANNDDDSKVKDTSSKKQTANSDNLKQSDKKLTQVIHENSDAEKDEIILTPRKRATRSLNAQMLDEIPKHANSSISSSKREQKSIIEISTDASTECDEIPSSPTRERKRRIESPALAFSLKSRITRSSPQILMTPKNGGDCSPAIVLESQENKITADNMAGNENNVVFIGDISSQLSAIRKELESLEALRLADLKHRTCTT